MRLNFRDVIACVRRPTSETGGIFFKSMPFISYGLVIFISTRQVTRATHVRNRVCPRVELILKIIIILLIIFLGFIKSKPC